MEANNTKAMRDALNKVGNAAAWIAESCNDQQTAKYMNDIIAIVQTALSAPARNCDRFNNPEDAYEAWKKECNRVKNVNGACRNCPYNTYKADSEKPSCVDMFLFAPAAERKGEGDGR